jgi:hypothetical protein
VSIPSPERFNNSWWVIGDVIGWIADRDPEKFGRIATVADLPLPIFQSDPNLRERAPEIRLLRALERGDLVAYDPSNGKPVPRHFWRFKNEGDVSALFGRGYSFEREHVLRLWPESEKEGPAVNAAMAAPPSTKGRRGPVPGTVDRFGEADRSLYCELEALTKGPPKMTVNAAALKLAREGNIKGVGNSTPESRATRLAKRYQKEKRSPLNSLQLTPTRSK